MTKNYKEHPLATDDEMKAYIEERHAATSPPLLTSDEAWRQIMSEVEQQERKEKSGQKKRIAMWTSVASFILVITIVFTPSSGSSFYQVTDWYFKIQDSVINIFSSQSSFTENPPNGPGSNDISMSENTPLISEEEMTLEEVQALAPFKIKKPDESPFTFVLEKTSVLTDSQGEIIEVTLTYRDEAGREFFLNQQPLSSDSGIGMVVDNQYTTHENIEINGEPAIFIEYKDSELINLVMSGSSHHLFISGKLSKEEIIELATSIR